MRLLLVVPTYNEVDNIRELLSRVRQAVPDSDVLIVDDNSPDGTADLCASLMHTDHGLRLIRRSGQRGLGRSYVDGLRYGIDNDYDVIGTLDADLSHDPGHLPSMLRVLDDHDVVVGSRYVRDGGTINWRIRRILLSWLANAFAARLLKIPAHDVTSGYRLYKRSALKSVQLTDIYSTGYSFLVELLYRLYRAGNTIGESPIIFYDRTLGQSKLGTSQAYIGAFQLLRIRLLGVQGERRFKN